MRCLFPLACVVVGCVQSTPPDAAAPYTPDPRPEPQSLVWITIDTLRADHVEPYGAPAGTTPALAELAARAVVFAEARSHVPWTKPSMATLFTSTLPATHGVYEWIDTLDPAQPTVAQVLRHAGYDTGAYVAHNAVAPPNTFHHGFEVFDTGTFGNADPSELITSEVLTDRALAGLATLEPPFFLWVHYMDPHNDYLLHPELGAATTSLERYGHEVQYTDQHVGRLLDAVDALQDTVVVVHSDHGEMFGEHGLIRHGHVLYDTVLRVPLVVRSDALDPAVVHEPVALVDLAPTILELVGAPVPDRFEGQALPRVGRGYAPEPAPMFLEVRFRTDVRGVLSDGFKLVRDLEDGSEELFDLVSDPGEQVDVSGLHPGAVAELGALIDAYER